MNAKRVYGLYGLNIKWRKTMKIELLEKLSKLNFIIERAVDAFAEENLTKAKIDLRIAEGIINSLLEEEC